MPNVPPPLLTRAFLPPPSSTIDPLVEEVSWTAWRLSAANPDRMPSGAPEALTGAFNCLVESTWRPGRSSVLSEVAWDPAADGGAGELSVHLAVGLFGSAGATADELLGVVPQLCETVHSCRVYSAAPVDPGVVVPGADRARCAPGRGRDRVAVHIEQRSWTLWDGEVPISLVSRFRTTVEPWHSVARHLTWWPHPVRVRATLLGTELSPADRIELEEALTRVRELRSRSDGREEVLFDCDRAITTLLDLRASYGTPLFVCELAVSSPEHLPESLARSLAACFTSQSDVFRQGGHAVVAGSRYVLGGFEVERDPAGWDRALGLGLPLRGGLGPHTMRSLVTLQESLIGWPVPQRDGIPSIPTRTAVALPVPAALRAGQAPATPIGSSLDGTAVALPIALRPRHMLVTGVPGAGKSTVLFWQAVDDLRSGRRIVAVDPHGKTAEMLANACRTMGLDPVVVDPLHDHTDRLAVLPALHPDGTNRRDVEVAARRLAEGLALSLPEEWTGPRFVAFIVGVLEIVAASGAELADAVVWMGDPAELHRRIGMPGVSPVTRSTFRMLLDARESADVRAWGVSKLQALVEGTVRRVIAPAGQGVDVAESSALGRPVVISLAGLSPSEGALIGHLVLGSVLDAALARRGAPGPLITCYADEAHRFPHRGLTRLIAEARKFNIGVVLAIQALSQVAHELSDMTSAVGTLVAFRSTPSTAARLAPIVGIGADDLIGLPDLHAVVSVAGHSATIIQVPPPDVASLARSAVGSLPSAIDSSPGPACEGSGEPGSGLHAVGAPARDESLGGPKVQRGSRSARASRRKE